MLYYDNYNFDIEVPKFLIDRLLSGPKEDVLIRLDNLQNLQELPMCFPDLIPHDSLYLGCVDLVYDQFDLYTGPCYENIDSGEIIGWNGNQKISYDMDPNTPSFHLHMRRFVCGLLFSNQLEEIGLSSIKQLLTPFLVQSSLH